MVTLFANGFHIQQRCIEYIVVFWLNDILVTILKGNLKAKNNFFFYLKYTAPEIWNLIRFHSFSLPLSQINRVHIQLHCLIEAYF